MLSLWAFSVSAQIGAPRTSQECIPMNVLSAARHIRVFYRGLRALASEIKKQTTAHLVEITFAAMPAVVHSLKVRMQTDSSVLR